MFFLDGIYFKIIIKIPVLFIFILYKKWSAVVPVLLIFVYLSLLDNVLKYLGTNWVHYPKEIVVPFTTYISKSLFGNLCSNSQLRHQSLLNITMNDWLFSHASSRHCLIYLVSSDKFTLLLKGLKSRIRRNLSKLCTCKNFTDISIIGIFFHEL